MAMFLRARSSADASDATQHINKSGGGGFMATLVSLLAFIFSGLSYYESSLKQAELEVFVPPMINYARDGDTDVFAIPVTIANSGSNTGTVLFMELAVENQKADADPKSKTFFSAFVGEHPREATAINRAFAPISVPGRATFSETVRFYPQGNALPRILNEEGDYKLTLKLLVARPDQPAWLEKIAPVSEPAPLVFVRNIPFVSHQHLTFRRGTIGMYAKDWKPATSQSVPVAQEKK
jgi:hypothetical protein